MMAFGQNSPIRFDGLLKGCQLMTAFGFENAEQNPMLTFSGNAIYSEEAVQGVITAFGQMRSSGRGTSQHMMQLTNRIIPGGALHAKAVAKSVPETRKLSETGTLEGTNC